MSRWRVWFSRAEWESVEVEANTETEAENLAWDAIGPGEYDLEEIEELED